MNRVIKFRAWDNKAKRMFPHQFLVRKDGLVFRQYNGGGTVEDFTLMQFTGLTDKNGKEIYEGDVVKNDKVLGKGSTLEVRFYQDRAGFWPMLFWEMHEVAEVEVIGNIYENPELLSV